MFCCFFFFGSKFQRRRRPRVQLPPRQERARCSRQTVEVDIERRFTVTVPQQPHWRLLFSAVPLSKMCPFQTYFNVEKVSKGFRSVTHLTLR